MVLNFPITDGVELSLLLPPVPAKSNVRGAAAAPNDKRDNDE